MKSFRIGIQMEPQHTTYADFARAVGELEAAGVDTLWTWDHFYPPWADQVPPAEKPGSPAGYHFEGWTLLTAMAMLTQRVEVGCLVTCNSYRNPALLSTMAKTVDHISAGRLILGMGAGWREEEYQIYGYPFGSAGERLRALEQGLITIRKRWAADLPQPVRQPVPILIGGDGEKFTLRLVAQYADLWNTGAAPEQFRHKCAVLEEWCTRVGRNPEDIERTVSIDSPMDPAACEKYLEYGARHLILSVGAPWDLAPVEQLLRWREQWTQP